MDSPSHRKNILNPAYSEVGFAAVNGKLAGKNTTIIVALYAKPALASVLGNTNPTFAAVAESNLERSESFMERLNRGLKSAAPSLIVTLALLGLAFLASLLAHKYRNQLPEHLRNSFYKHHALIKMSFITLLAVTAILSYGSGMI
jgi:hypothetical protein